MSVSAGVAIATVLCILAIVAIVGNSLVCAIIMRNRNMRTPMNYLLLNLSAADMMYAMFIVPHVLFSKLSMIHHPDGVTGTVLCKLLTGGNLAWLGATSSFVIFAAIAIERYYAVRCPHDNKRKLTKRKLRVIIPCIWIFSMIVNIPEFLVLNFDKESKVCAYFWPEEWMEKAYQSLKWNGMVALALLVMIVLYSIVVYTLWFKQNDDNAYQRRGVTRVRKRVTSMILTVSVIFGICWGMDQVVYSLKFTASYNIGPVPIAIANTMAMFNSAVNPFVYALLNQKFKEKMKRVICCTGCSTLIAHPTQGPQNIELTNSITHPSQPLTTSQE